MKNQGYLVSKYWQLMVNYKPAGRFKIGELSPLQNA